jgi:formate dehydrogenase major subunit
VIQGSNMAECHPVGFRWVMAARERGATIFHVDPRFTRTSAMADVHVPLRPGTDVAFLGGIIRHVLENEAYFREYVVRYTNAATVVTEDFEEAGVEGLFGGWDAEKGAYDIESWQYDNVEDIVPASGHKHLVGEPGAGGGPRGKDINDRTIDETLQHPRCVFQILRRHFARYTPEMVEQVCGTPPEIFAKICEALCKNSGPERTSAFVYSVGWTQHSIGVQYIRCAAILQLLLGNIGRPGGGILALRGHASIQGSTDIPTLYNLLPGYLPMPHAKHATDLKSYVEANQAADGLMWNFPKYVVSLLKAWYGDNATAENGFAFGNLPRLTGDHSHMQTVADMCDGKLQGYFVMGENPVVGSPNAGMQRKGMRRLKWMVVRDLVLTETAEFWRTSPEHDRGEVRAEDIDTEVFFFPAAAHTEKDGAFTNTQRLLQWHHKAVEPPGDCRSELHFLYHLGLRLKDLYAGSQDAKDRALLDLAWSYPEKGPHRDPDAEAVLREISGYRIEDGAPVGSYEELKEDGSTACGCWIYSGCYAGGENLTARRKPAREQSWVAPEWAWSWPKNVRLLYNRASADAQGRPWSERKRYVVWDGQRWTGPDVPDFPAQKDPAYRPGKNDRGLDALAGTDPFIIQADGRGWIFAPSGLLDGPLPAHYEPQESVVRNALHRQQCNPARREWRRPADNPYGRAFDDAAFPFVLTTYRLTEHHTAGGMSRWLSWLSELQPEAFCEVSPELARERGLAHGGMATVATPRGSMSCRVLVTRRLQPLRLDGRTVHVIGVPYHFGARGRVTGDAANELTSLVADPNVEIMETKALTANIFPGAHARVPTPWGGGTRDPRRDRPGGGQPEEQPSQDSDRGTS